MLCEKCGREKGPNRLCLCEVEAIKRKYDNANRGMMNVFTSPVMLLLIIIMAISVLMAILSATITGEGGASSVSFVSGIISAIPSIILLLGVGMLYVHSKEGNIPMKTTGFTIIKGYMYVLATLMALSLIAMLMSTLMMFALGDKQEFINILKEALAEQYVTLGLEEYESVLYEGFLIASVILDIVLTLFVVVLMKLISTVEYVKNIAKGNGYGGISMFAIIMIFAMGAFTIISALSYLKEGNIYLFTSLIFSSVMDILMGIIFVKVRNVIAKAMEDNSDEGIISSDKC